MAPKTLTVVMVNSWPKDCELIHTGETALVSQRRTVQITLTEEQRALLTPQEVGVSSGKPVHEKIGPVWLEPLEEMPGSWRCPEHNCMALADHDDYYLCETCNSWWKGDQKLEGGPPWEETEELRKELRSLQSATREAGKKATEEIKRRGDLLEAGLKHRERLERRLSSIAEIAQGRGDGAPDATPEEKDWLRVEALASGEKEGPACSQCETLRGALRDLFANDHLDLGDLVYQIREREGKGWDGPCVTQWSDAVVAAKLLVKAPERTSP